MSDFTLPLHRKLRGCIRLLPLLALVGAPVGLWSGLASAEESPEEKSPDLPLQVHVPVPPYEYLVERIGGDLVEAHAIAGEGKDCHSYTPTPQQLAEILAADMLFTGELAFEGNFFVAGGDGSDGPEVLNLLDGLDLLDGSCEICEQEAVAITEAREKGLDEEAISAKYTHSHEEGELQDPHVWLSPKYYAKQGERIASLLKARLPAERRREIDARLASFRKEMAELDAELAEALAPRRGERFYVYHGAFAYFARDYGMEQVAIEINYRGPTPKQLEGIANRAREDRVRLVLAQPQFDQHSSAALAELIGGEVVPLDPLARDVPANLRQLGAVLQAGE